MFFSFQSRDCSVFFAEDRAAHGENSPLWSRQRKVTFCPYRQTHGPDTVTFNYRPRRRSTQDIWIRMGKTELCSQPAYGSGSVCTAAAAQTLNTHLISPHSKELLEHLCSWYAHTSGCLQSTIHSNIVLLFKTKSCKSQTLENSW